MQHNSTPKTRSQLLRATEQAKKRSRHRFIGSIVLLIIALIVLLNITAKIKPIPINPEKIEIQNTKINPPIIQESTIINNGNSLAKITSEPQSNIAIINSNVNDNPIASEVSSLSENNISSTSKPTASEIRKPTISNDLQNLQLTPQIITEKIQNKLTPQQILNGDLGTGENIHKYYIQLIASTNKEKLIKIQQQLSQDHIKSIIQPIQTINDTTIYRLRMGPYSTKEEANSDLVLFNQ